MAMEVQRVGDAALVTVRVNKATRGALKVAGALTDRGDGAIAVALSRVFDDNFAGKAKGLLTDDLVDLILCILYLGEHTPVCAALAKVTAFEPPLQGQRCALLLLETPRHFRRLGLARLTVSACASAAGFGTDGGASKVRRSPRLDRSPFQRCCCCWL